MLTVATIAFLNMISYAEGTNNNYGVLFGFHTMRHPQSKWTEHPNIAIRHGKYISTAAGKYQFLYTTYAEMQKKCDIPDFKPASQDKACVCLLNTKGVRHTTPYKDLESFSIALSKIKFLWASIPGAPYGQPVHTEKALWAVYKTELKKGSKL